LSSVALETTALDSENPSLTNTALVLDDSAIERLRKYIHSISAIDLHDSDIPLIKHLFQQLADEHGLETPDEVLAWLKLKKDPSVTLDWLNSVFTSEMTFFQDFAYFKFIRHVCMPHLLAKKHEEKAITILCVGSGYGQEPYSLAIMLNQAIPELRDWTISIIAADPSSSRLNRCQQGVFTSQEIEQGTPKKLVETNFEELENTQRVKKTHRKLVTTLNLDLNTPINVIPPVDLILARFLPSSFRSSHQKTMIEKLQSRLNPKGYMLLDRSCQGRTYEGLKALDNRFQIPVFTTLPGAEKPTLAEAVQEVVQETEVPEEGNVLQLPKNAPPAAPQLVEKAENEEEEYPVPLPLPVEDNEEEYPVPLPLPVEEEEIEVEAHSDEAAELRAQLQEVLGEVRQLRSTIESDPAEASEESSSAGVEFETQFEAVMGEVRDIKTSLTEELVQERIAEIEKQRDKAQSELNESQNELNEIQSGLKQSEKERQKQSLQLERQAAELERQELRMNKQSSVLESQTAQLEGQAEEIEKQAISIENQADQLDGQSEQIDKQSEELGQHLGQLEEQGSSLEQQAQTLEKQSRLLGEQSSQIENQVGALDRQSSLLDKQSEKLETQSSQIENQSMLLEAQSTEIAKQALELEKLQIGKEELSGLLNLEVKAKEQARQMVDEAQKAMDELAGYH